MKHSRYKYLFNIVILFLIVIILYSCSNKEKQTISIFAAAGTMLATNEVCDSFNLTNAIEIERNFAASGALARQIKSGAEADIYISANKQWIDFLIENGILYRESISKLANNKLVIICPKDQEVNLEFNDDFDIKSAVKNKISIGDPKYVPVGKYAKQFLDTLTWYRQIEDQIILAKDVTSVLHYVELGECDWGIVYYSEAIKSDKIKIAYEIPADLYKPINFYIGLINSNSQTNEFYNYFSSNTAKEIFTKHGFIMPK